MDEAHVPLLKGGNSKEVKHESTNRKFSKWYSWKWIFFSVLDCLMWRGVRKRGHLGRNDLYEIPESMEVKTVKRRFATVSPTRIRKKLLFALHDVFWKEIWFCSGISILEEFTMFLGPLILCGLIFCFDQSDKKPVFYWLSFVGAISVVSCVVIHVILFIHTVHSSQRLGLKIVSALTDHIYNLILQSRRKSDGKSKENENKRSEGDSYSDGEALNIISLDIRVVGDNIFCLIKVLSGIGLFVGSITILFIFIGWQAIVILALSVLLVPCNFLAGVAYSSLRNNILYYTDSRLKLLKEVIENVRVLRFFGDWIDIHFYPKLVEIRKKEIWKTLGFYGFQTIVSTLFQFYPIMMGCFCFTLLYLTCEVGDAKLQPSVLFPSLCYIFVLSGMALLFCQHFANSMNFFTSIRRIQKFIDNLTENEFIPAVVITNEENMRNKDDLIDWNNTSFKWSKNINNIINKQHPFQDSFISTDSEKETEEEEMYIDQDEFKLKCIDLKIRRGEFTLLHGRVGSGKSSLFSSLFGEMVGINKRKKIKVVEGTKIFVVKQTPFIFNTSLLRNITLDLTIVENNNNNNNDNIFYESMDHEDIHELYKILELSCFQHEIDTGVFQNGLKSELGSKGISVSGGERIRIGLARCLYQFYKLKKEWKKSTLSDTKKLNCVFFFDDIFSALDVKVSKSVYENVFRKYLKRETIVLISHRLEFIKYSNRTMKMDQGELIWDTVSNRNHHQQQRSVTSINNNHHQQEEIIQINEDYDDDEEGQEGILMRYNNEDEEEEEEEEGEGKIEVNILDFGKFFEQEKENNNNNNDQIVDILNPPKKQLLEEEEERNNKKSSRLVENEDEEIGRIRFGVLIFYLSKLSPILSSFSLSGVVFFLFIISIFIIRAVTAALGSIMFTKWVSMVSGDKIYEENGVDLEIGRTFMMYVLYVTTSIVLICIGSFFVNIMSLLGSYRIHNMALRRVLSSRISWFDQNPVGRILSRFSRDIENMDTKLGVSLYNLCFVISEYLEAMIILSYVTSGIFVLPILIIFILYFLLAEVYRSTSRALKRLESTTRSPLYSHISDTLNGLDSIRIFGLSNKCEDIHDQYLDDHINPTYTSIVAKVWLIPRIESIGIASMFFVFCIAIVLAHLQNEVVFHDYEAWVGLSFAYVLSVYWRLSHAVQYFTDTEKYFNDVERLHHYCKNIPIEESTLGEEEEEEQNINNNNFSFSEGKIVFENYSMKYRKELELTLKNCSFEIPGGSKVAIIGRTGSGKSSLTRSILRISEASSGTIKIDGIDISKIPLDILRKNIGMIPQDPILFHGTIRSNLLISSSSSSNYNNIIIPSKKRRRKGNDEIIEDSFLWKVLEKVELKERIQRLPDGLSSIVEENGANFSPGERQLLCIARSIVNDLVINKVKIVILDEPSSSIDTHTDEIIQRVIREEFKNCTSLTIAHRLETISLCDYLLIMDDGTVKEFCKNKKGISLQKLISHD